MRNKSRVWLIFICLKVAEIFGIVFIPYYNVRLWNIMINGQLFTKSITEVPLFAQWLIGLLLLAPVAIILWIIFIWTLKNFDWAKTLNKRLR